MDRKRAPQCSSVFDAVDGLYTFQDVSSYIKSRIKKKNRAFAKLRLPLEVEDCTLLADTVWLLQTAALIACDGEIWRAICADPNFGGKPDIRNRPDYFDAIAWVKYWTSQPAG
jgi:hypothetical protein